MYNVSAQSLYSSIWDHKCHRAPGLIVVDGSYVAVIYMKDEDNSGWLGVMAKVTSQFSVLHFLDRYQMTDRVNYYYNNQS
jgi:hypothetical protein